jgi:hypothetical protein
MSSEQVRLHEKRQFHDQILLPTLGPEQNLWFQLSFTLKINKRAIAVELLELIS